MNFAPVTGSSVCTNMRILQRQRAGQGRRSGLEGHKYHNSVPARTLRGGISVKIYPSSYDLYTQYQFMFEMNWLTVHFLYM